MEPLTTAFELPEKKRTVDFYPLRVWLSTLFFGPVLYITAEVLTTGKGLLMYTGFAALCFVFSLIVTLPFLCIYWYVYDILVERAIKTLRIRMILSPIAFGMILLTFLCFASGDYRDKGITMLLCSYIVANIVSAWRFKFAVEMTTVKTSVIPKKDIS
ncbi:MAG: hypothetical protein ABW007_03760 [Chitinophagaceae bacterium]